MKHRTPWNRGIAIVLLLSWLSLNPGQCFAAPEQTAAAARTAGAEGKWQGTLHVPGKDLRFVLDITAGADKALGATLISLDQGGQNIPVTTVSFEEGVLRFKVTGAGLSYEGKIATDKNTIAGNLTQGGSSFPLNLDRSTPSTAWDVPAAAPAMQPLPADMHPSFEVVTIKPSHPDTAGKLFRVQGRHFTTINTTVVDMLDFAYGLHPKQIVNAPAWMSQDKFDMEGTPDAEGAPSESQWKGMMQKMLADRFQLRFTQDTREMPAYTLTVAKSGPKLSKAPDTSNSVPGLFFSQLGDLHVMNANMEDFTHLMQQVVLDRPVVDRTGLKGRWNWDLKWTPDDSQFAGLGTKSPKQPTEAADAPPPLFTAIQEEIGLKLDAARTAVPVLVIDHVKKPSDN